MRILQSYPNDQQILSPSSLVKNIHSFTDEQIRPNKKVELQSSGNTAPQISFDQSRSMTHSIRKTKKRDQQGLKKLIRVQKINQICHRFIQKLKINNIESNPVIYQPYQVQQRQSIYNIHGIQLPDSYEKALSVFIALFIMVCLLIDSIAALFPQVLQYPVVKVGQIAALIMFLIEFVSSCIVVKMIEGKKIEKITHIISNYVSDGLIIDFAYLVVLVISFFHDVNNLRLIILLKLPQCFERIERIQNTYVNTFYKEQYWGLMKVFLINFILAHFLGLLLLLMAEIDPNNSWLTYKNFQNCVWYEKYIWSYYWGTTIMLTVGFGDISPANYKQAICVVIIQTFSCLALAYNINCIGNLINNIKSQDNQKNKSIKTFKILSSRNNISQDLELKIHNYIEQSTKIKKRFNFEEQSTFISALPNQLKADFLKESNKKIFQKIVFLKNLTEKTLLALSEVIQMKICHPEQIIKKRGDLSGITILKQGKIAYCTKLLGSNWSNISIDKVNVQENDEPYLLSLDFISLDRSSYEIKSEEYSILYLLSMEQTLQTLKTCEIDYEHFCFLRDRSRNLATDYEVFKCENCKSYHTKFDCPKIHYYPLKKHIISKYLYLSKRAKNIRNSDFARVIVKKQEPFQELQNNLRIIDSVKDVNNKFTAWKHKNTFKLNQTISNLKLFGLTLNQNLAYNNLFSRLNLKIKSGTENTEIQQKSIKSEEKPQKSTQKLEHQLLKDVLKDEISQVMVKNNEVWTVECDEIKNFKFYFPACNASALSHTNKKNAPKSLFG